MFSLPYSIPEEILEETERKGALQLEYKKHIIAPLIPGDKSTYIYDTESDYYNMYRTSRYAITFKKYGFDCLRHYEILACGCVPIFLDIDQCPGATMFNFPKHLVHKTVEDAKAESDDNYIKRLHDIFNYTKKYLTCSASAWRVMHQICNTGNIDIMTSKRVLFLSGAIGYRAVNYTRELTAIGLKRILGANFIDMPRIHVLYSDCQSLGKYIGKGFTYGGRLPADDASNRNIIRDKNTIIQQLKNKQFDIVIYGKVGNKRGEVQPVEELELWNEVYESGCQIVFFYGGDRARCVLSDACLQLHSKFGICFVREYL